MNPKFVLYTTVLAACGAVALPIGQPAFAAEVSGAPQSQTLAASLPMDLARGSAGAKLVIRAPKNPGAASDPSNDNRSAQALISDDASLGYPLAPGVTSVLITLPKIEVLSRFNFISYEAAGQVTVSASPTKLDIDSADWKPVAHSAAFSAQQVVACPLGSVEARYVKIDFDTKVAGRIASFGLFGLPKIGSYKVQPLSFNYVSGSPGAGGFADLQNRNVFFDYANLYTGASVVSVSHGGDLTSAQSMLDGNAETNYTFDPTDPNPTMVVDLGVRRSLNHVSCVYEAPAGHLEVYLVDNPDKVVDSANRVNLSYIGEPTAGETVGAPDLSKPDAAKRKAVLSADTTGQPGVSRATGNVGSRNGRFLIAVFHPVAEQPDFKDAPRDFKDAPRDFKDTARDFKDAPRDFKDVASDAPAVATPAGTPFRVLAFSAFGDTPSNDTISRLPGVPIQPPGGGNNGGGGNTPPVNPPFPGPPQGVMTP